VKRIWVKTGRTVAEQPILHVDDLTAGYGESQVLFGVSLAVSAGEIITLLGRNGMGKTTTVSTIMGIVTPRSGAIRFEGEDIHRLPAHRIARRGLGLVPEGRQIFPNLTVEENLIATAANRSKDKDPWTLSKVLDLFPKLAERIDSMGGLLSGGEQSQACCGDA
jgi:branched-chain amino acid transport system ATP-binding protein